MSQKESRAREERLVQAYLAGKGLKESAEEAGYSSGTAKSAHRLLEKPSVQAKLGDAVAQSANMARVMQGLADIAFADPGDYWYIEEGKVVLRDLSHMTPSQRGVVKSVGQNAQGMQIQLHDRQAALTKLLQLLQVK